MEGKLADSIGRGKGAVSRDSSCTVETGCAVRNNEDRYCRLYGYGDVVKGMEGGVCSNLKWLVGESTSQGCVSSIYVLFGLLVYTVSSWPCRNTRGHT